MPYKQGICWDDDTLRLFLFSFWKNLHRYPLYRLTRNWMGKKMNQDVIIVNWHKSWTSSEMLLSHSCVIHFGESSLVGCKTKLTSFWRLQFDGTWSNWIKAVAWGGIRGRQGFLLFDSPGWVPRSAWWTVTNRVPVTVEQDLYLPRV